MLNIQIQKVSSWTLKFFNLAFYPSPESVGKLTLPICP
jgi:hypothetical protein